jgi:hypothetical protein
VPGTFFKYFNNFELLFTGPPKRVPVSLFTFQYFVVWCSLPGCAVEMDEHVLRGSYTVAKLGGWEIGNVSLRHCITLWVVPSGSSHLLSLHTVANLATNSRECTFFKNEEFEHDNLLLR